MNRDQKSAVVDEIAEHIQSSQAIFAVDYRGITVAQVAELREKLRAADARFQVVKNSLSEIAADRAGAEHLKPLLVGPTALTFVKGDAAAAAKSLNDTARALNLLEFRGGIMNGDTLSADDVRSIARLPSREVLYAQLVGTIASPISGLVRTLNALIAGVAIQLQAIADQGLVPAAGATPAPAAEAPAAEAPAAEAPAPEAPAAEAPAAEEAPAAAAEDEAPAAAAEEAPAPAAAEETPATEASEKSEVQEAAEQTNDDPDSEPHDAPVQPDQAEGEDETTEEGN